MRLQYKAMTLSTQDTLFLQMILSLSFHIEEPTFSIRALEMAKRSYNAHTTLITGLQSPISINTDFRIETCPQENCGAFTISLTSAIVRVLQWIDLFSNGLIDRFRIWLDSVILPFIIEKPPKFHNKLIIVGDLIREAVAHEVALKISETSYLPVRSYGMDKFYMVQRLP